MDVRICCYYLGVQEGCWKDGNQNGFGRIIYPSGEHYIGEFKEGFEHSLGTLFDKSGKVKNLGEWNMGKCNRNRNLLDQSEQVIE